MYVRNILSVLGLVICFTGLCCATFVRSALGRGRAWLRLALMQKRLSDYFKVLLEHKDDVLVYV